MKINPAGPVPKRREVRLPATLKVRVVGTDADSKFFHQAATTMDISLSGTRITGLAAKLNEGDIVSLQSIGALSRFRVCWVRDNQDGTHQLGMHCMENERCPWNYWLEIRQPNEGDRRSSERYLCNGSASLCSASFSAPIQGTLRGISADGCFVQSINVAAVGETLSGQFTLNGVQINAVAVVCRSLRAVGMGLQWCDLGCDGQERLKSILRTLPLDNIDVDSGKAKALAKVNPLHQLVAALQKRLESNPGLMHAETIRQLSGAQEKLAAALKSMQS